MASSLSSSETAASPDRIAAQKADLELNNAKLQSAIESGQGEIYALQWLAKAEVALKMLPVEAILGQQSKIEETFLRIICPLELDTVGESQTSVSASSSHGAAHNAEHNAMPRMGRPARHIAARCLVTLYLRAETRSLYEMVQSLMRIAGEETKGRPTPEKESKAASLYVAGELFLAVGHNVMSQFIALLTLCQRLTRNTNLAVIIRYHALACLAKVLRNGGKSLNDQTYRDINRTLRYAISDHAGAIARAGAECFLSLLDTTEFISSLADIDSLLLAVFKALESADFTTKQALSKLAGRLLAQTQKQSMVQRPPKPRRQKSSKADDKDLSSDEEGGRSVSTAQAAAAMRAPMLSPIAMLERISAHFTRTSSTRAARCAYLEVYATLLELQGSSWVHANYDVILKHLIEDIPSALASAVTRADLMSMRIGINTILRSVIGERLLDEPAQVGAIEQISTAYLKRWPILTPGQQPPSRTTLVMAFNEVTGLLSQLNSAPTQVVDALLDAVVRCLAHPSHSVQVSAAWCLRTLCLVNPSLLKSCIDTITENLKRDITSLQNSGERGGAELPKRAVGHARGLGTLISIIVLRPLYISFDASGQIVDLAIQLLKDSANHSLAISAVEIQVAWILLGALMSLGPEFTKLHLPKLLSMWRSALPKLGESASTRSEAEWSFLLHARECTLGCIYAFLLANTSSSLLNLDVARRIVALLSHGLSFVNSFASQHPTLSQDHVPGTERGGSLTLLDREQMVRRRVYQCFAALVNNSALEVMQEALIGACIQTFAEPERHVGSTAQAAIAASSGNFVNVWSACDGYACGTTSLLQGDQCFVALTSASLTIAKEQNSMNRDAVEAEMDILQRKPIIGAIEFDPLVLYTSSDDRGIPSPAPPATGVVDAAIEIFAKLMPFQKRDTQITAMESLLNFMRSPKLDRNPGRKMAIQVNACVASLGMLRVAMQPSVGNRLPAGFRNERLAIATRTQLIEFLTQGDPPLRGAASEAYGRLATLSGSQAMASQVQILVDHVVSNRSPNVRAGCAAAFGSIYEEVGGLATGPLTKTVVDILFSLANDPHPMVHFNSLEALTKVIDAASLSYSPYMQSTLGMLVKLYMLSTHEPEGGSAGSVNLRADLPAIQTTCRVLNALIGVIGPDLQDLGKVRTLLLIVLDEFSRELDDGILVEATKAMQHFVLFAPQHVDMAQWILALQNRLKNSKRPLKIATINAFYQLIQRNALLVSKTCGNSLVEDFFALLDGDADTEGVRQVLSSWLAQTAHLSPTSWIEICQRVSRNASSQQSVKTVKSIQQASQVGALQDEEAAAIDLGEDTGTNGARLQSRWRTRLFALQCLHQVLAAVRRAENYEHFSTPRHHSQLSSRVADLIKMAFTASTSVNLDIRLEGLTILNDVIAFFKDARDPDFEDALLLEQHQAPIAAALTPAFLSDSVPEVLAKALEVCAAFVACGVVSETEKLGRILKLLTKALESARDPDMDQLGDVKNLSSNAAMILRIAVYDAWAQLQVASTKQAYIVTILEPHVQQLSSVWVDTLAEYSHLRADPDGVGVGVAGIISRVLDSTYSGLVRGVLLPYHQRSWPVVLDAVASLMAQDSEFIASAMDGDKQGSESTFRSEPALHFYPLYGLSFEALATASGTLREADTVRKTLLALRFLCRPQFAGNALLRDDLFDELIQLCYRIVVSQGSGVQIATVHLVASIASSYQSRLIGPDDGAQANDDDVVISSSKLSTCLRLPLFAISFSRSKAAASTARSDQRASLTKAAFTSYLRIAAQASTKQREQLYVLGFMAYSDLLRDETSDADLVGPTLASLKELCHASIEVFDESLSKAVHGFLSDCLNTLDSVRSRSGAIAFNKSKNALLSIIVVITTLPYDARLSHTILEDYCYELTSRLRRPVDEDGLQIALTALNCIKTLLLAASRESAESLEKPIGPALALCVGQMLTNLVQVLHALWASPSADWTAHSIRVTEEALKTLTGFARVGADEQHRARISGIVLPIFALFLRDPGQVDDEDAARISRLRDIAIQQTLALARQYPVAFRAVMRLMQAQTRDLIEASLKRAIGLDGAAGLSRSQQDSASATRAEAKTIELRSFG